MIDSRAGTVFGTTSGTGALASLSVSVSEGPIASNYLGVSITIVADSGIQPVEPLGR